MNVGPPAEAGHRSFVLARRPPRKATPVGVTSMLPRSVAAAWAATPTSDRAAAGRGQTRLESMIRRAMRKLARGFEPRTC